ncbi:helix-turn-helix domain-containing protein [Janibacter limosus]|uniref:TetR/AcrR family transcriptional regulator n=1 Tax=Janibacter limosus TaxID=53458 RepID=A0AC61U588_9MICO|nr:TetR/AcrR family transcriptional regulator [Janibacter limosus]UUZ45212.1 helix-turn-helix domain-containing protein [Janibacter limosus]
MVQSGTAAQTAAPAVESAGRPADEAPGRREQNRTRLRHNVHATARQLVNERGYDEVTVEDIAAGAGISVATFYRHFSGKDDVITGRWLSPERYGSLVDRIDVSYDMPRAVAGLFSRYAAAVESYDVSLHTRLKTIHLDAGLRTAMARGREEDVQTLCDLFGRMIGVDPAVQPIQLAGAVTITARSTTMSYWAALDGSESLTELLDECARALAPMLTQCQVMAPAAR